MCACAAATRAARPAPSGAPTCQRCVLQHPCCGDPCLSRLVARLDKKAADDGHPRFFHHHRIHDRDGLLLLLRRARSRADSASGCAGTSSSCRHRHPCRVRGAMREKRFPGAGGATPGSPERAMGSRAPCPSPWLRSQAHAWGSTEGRGACPCPCPTQLRWAEVASFRSSWEAG